MKRHDWVRRLFGAIEAHRSLPFRWAGRDDSHDCCTFVAACLDAQTGGTYLDDLLQHYTDEASALAYIKSCGGLAETLSRHLKKSIPVSFMRPGDVALVVREGKEFVGICMGDHVFSAGPSAVVSNPREFVTHAWRVE